MKSVLKFFSSVKLAIILLIILALTSILGTLIPQQRTVAEYTAHYGQLANLLIRLQLTGLYHSIWYIALLSLFALNLIVCTLERLSPKWRKTFHPRIEAESKGLLALKINGRFKRNAGLKETREEIRRELHARRYRLREEAGENKIFLLGRKRILNWYGADIVHLGLLVILAGAILSGLLSFRQDLTFQEGQTLPVPRAPFRTRLDKFTTEYYQNGSVKDWKSTLTVLENAQPVLTRTIEVNYPLTYRGFVFYQSGYGNDWENTTVEVWLKKKNDPSYLKKVEARVGEKRGLDEGGLEISVARFIPDFILNNKNEPETRSLQPDNPAVFIEGFDANQKVFSGWIFANYPDFARIHSNKETDYSFEFKSFKSGETSVIHVAKDPGVPLIWLGCTFLMAGLLLAFYWPAREIKLILEETQGKTDVIAGGIALKSREAFEKEFQALMSVLRRPK
jgi:cytochrome c biogenesis protein